MKHNKEIPSSVPDDRYMSQVKLGSRGQIVIPKKVRDMFGLDPGSTLFIFADKNQGIALQKFDGYDDLFLQVFQVKENNK